MVDNAPILPPPLALVNVLCEMKCLCVRIKSVAKQCQNSAKAVVKTVKSNRKSHLDTRLPISACVPVFHTRPSAPPVCSRAPEIPAAPRGTAGAQPVGLAAAARGCEILVACGLDAEGSGLYSVVGCAALARPGTTSNLSATLEHQVVVGDCLSTVKHSQQLTSSQSIVYERGGAPSVAVSSLLAPVWTRLTAAPAAGGAADATAAAVAAELSVVMKTVSTFCFPHVCLQCAPRQRLQSALLPLAAAATAPAGSGTSGSGSATAADFGPPTLATALASTSSGCGETSRAAPSADGAGLPAALELPPMLHGATLSGASRCAPCGR